MKRAPKILITPRSFGKANPKIYDKMRTDGFEVVRNPTGNILTQTQLKTYLADCDGLIVGVDPVDAEVLSAAPKLKAIAKYGVGLDNIDLENCRRRGILVSRTVGANTEAVADFTFALILAVARKVVTIDQRFRQGNWQKLMSQDVYGQTLGLIGLGAIGKSVARRALGFRMPVIAYDPFWDEDWARAHEVKKASLDTIYRQSDFISLHVPLLPETKNMIDAQAIAKMRPQTILINTARGGLIDEAALLAALESGKIMGAGLDAFQQEPPQEPRWQKLEQVVLGTHAAAATQGAAQEMTRMAYANLKQDLLATESTGR